MRRQAVSGFGEVCEAAVGDDGWGVERRGSEGRRRSPRRVDFLRVVGGTDMALSAYHSRYATKVYVESGLRCCSLRDWLGWWAVGMAYGALGRVWLDFDLFCKDAAVGWCARQAEVNACRRGHRPREFAVVEEE